MPYRIRKAPKKNAYWVIGQDGTHHSNEPLPLARAKKQLTALNIAHAEKKRGGAATLAMPLKSLVEEHKGLVKVLMENKPKPIARMAKKQSKELEHYKSLYGKVKGSGFLNDIFNLKKIANEFINPQSLLRQSVGKVTNEIVNPDSIVRRRITDVSRGIRTNYPPSSRRTIEKYGNYRIVSLNLRRDPIQSALNTAFELLTLGQWNKAKAAENKDKLFHLGIMLGLVGPNGQQASVIVEKNEVINVGPAKSAVGGTEMIQSTAPNGVTLQSFLDKGLAAAGPERFFKYDPFQNNCQDFVAMLLQANGVYTQQAEAFVKQDVSGLLKRLPGWTGTVAKGITDLGGIANVALEGGKLKGGHFPASYKNTVHHMYNQITLKPEHNRERPVKALLEYIIQKNMGTTTYELNIQNLAQELLTDIVEHGASVASIWTYLGRVVGGITQEPGAQIATGNQPYPPSKRTGMGKLRGGILNAAQIRDLDADQRAFDKAHALTTRRSLANSFFNKVDGYHRRGHLKKMTILEFRATDPPHSNRWIYVPDNTNMNVGYVYYMEPPPTAAQLAERARTVRRPTVAVRPGPRPAPEPVAEPEPEPEPEPLPVPEPGGGGDDLDTRIREDNRRTVAMKNLKDQVGIGLAWYIPEELPDYDIDLGMPVPIRPALKPMLATDSLSLMGAEPIPTYWGHIRTADPIRARPAPPPPAPPPPPSAPEWLPFSQAHLTEQEKADRKLISKTGKGKRKPLDNSVVETPARKRNRPRVASDSESGSESSSDSDSDYSEGDEVGFDYNSEDDESSDSDSESEGEGEAVAEPAAAPVTGGARRLIKKVMAFIKGSR